MSMDMFWSPNTPPEGALIPRELKYLLAPTYLGHDGTIGGKFELTQASDCYLRGIEDATQSAVVRAGVKALRLAIATHGSIIVECRE
jgi:hypothetical protein